MRQQKIYKLLNSICNIIDRPLMDTKNISELIITFILSPNRYFCFEFTWKLFRGIPTVIKALILAENKNSAFEMLKSQLVKLNYKNGIDNVSFDSLNIDAFIVELMYDNYIIISEPRIEHLVVKQGYYDGGSGPADEEEIIYTMHEYKHKCKPQRQWIKLYKDRSEYYAVHSYWPDERLDLEYSEKLVEETQQYIQYLF